MRLLLAGDPVKFRRDLASAYSEDAPPAVFPIATFLTILVAGFSYFTVATLLLLNRLPGVPLREVGWLALCLVLGWLGYRNAFPAVKDLPAPKAVPAEAPGEGLRLVIDPRLNRLHQAGLLSRYGATMLCFLLFIDLLAMMVTGMVNDEWMRPLFPLTIIVAIMFVMLIIAGFLWARYLKLMVNEPAHTKLATVCPVCDKPILPGTQWVIEPVTCRAHHPRCLELKEVKAEELPAAVLSGLPPEDAVALSEPGRACRGCGQFIDPGADSFRDCPDCGLTFHHACYGDDVLCTYCAGGETVPAVAERIARDNEARHRVPRGAYDPESDTTPAPPSDDELTVCRSCGLPIVGSDSKVACGRCRRTYHTACMAGGGLCCYCTAGEPVPDDVEAYCREVAERGFQPLADDAYTCPFCEEEISELGPGYRFCPYCGADLGVPEVYKDITEDEADTYAENLARGLEHMGDSLPVGPETVEERHGWLRQKNVGCLLYFVAFVLTIIGFVTANYLPLPGADVLRGFVLGLLGVSVVVAVVQWVVIKVRPWIWPMIAPSPTKQKLINMRTTLFWIAGLAALGVAACVYPDDAGLNHAAHYFKWITLGAGAAGSFLALASLLVK